MAVLCILLLTRFLLQAAANSTAALISPPECCLSMLDANGTCPITSQCSPGCYRHWTEDGASTCLKCRKETNLEFEAFHNLTSCRNISFHEEDLKMNASTAHPFVRSMAFFFYLKRSNVLPDLFYRRNKASILQPSETASMIPTPASSVRKPRYVRRERSSVTSASAIVNSDAETRVSNV
ncbi:uncharacterized protein C1orf159-like isoform X2 [Rhinatrema bivittatum]|uniref:uncharacterized protein C1orf159 homolog isoform X2 n=1 Tax=Rhinatrema bivittatum TaxID=194408 RepID=UPI0011266CD5|nr:uncharacterized protein C1orf159 homolog isoform X2 [Rhinatrema bivittatum]XP_029434029.1 uncharacterized protein C1orf159-like isoform X2 [Rhinatrema bivittatum]